MIANIIVLFMYRLVEQPIQSLKFRGPLRDRGESSEVGTKDGKAPLSMQNSTTANAMKSTVSSSILLVQYCDKKRIQSMRWVAGSRTDLVAKKPRFTGLPCSPTKQ